MTSAITNLRCKRDGCKPEETGDCIDGLPLSDCPNRYVFEPVDEEFENVGSPLVDSDDGNGIRLHNGEPFSTVEADQHLRRHGATVVAFIGYPDAGKTTAAIMLYELSKRRQLDPFGFAGSNTIRGFQERTHKSLLASGRRTPDTVRTSGGAPVSFLHLRLQKFGQQGEPIELLLSDRSGEDFEKCLDNPYLCEAFPEISRANCHVFLIDGAKLANPDLASKHISNFKRLIIALNQCNLLSESGLVQIVLTKHDLVIQSEHREKALERFNIIIESIKSQLNGTVRITEHKLAARPLCSQYNLGNGLVDLINDWLPQKQETEYCLVIPKITTGTPYELLINTVSE